MLEERCFQKIAVLFVSKVSPTKLIDFRHTTYTRNNMGQKREGNCGLWVLNEIIKKNLKKIVGAVWELPAK